MIETTVLVGGVLALLLWYSIRRYNRIPTTANVWVVAWIMAACIVFVAQVAIYLYLFGLRVE